MWAIAVIIFSYTSSPQVKISQKVLGGLLFFDSHCICVCEIKTWDTLCLLGAIEIHCNRAVYVSLNVNSSGRSAIYR